MDGMISVVLVMCVDVEVAGPGPCMEPRDGFLDLKIFLQKRFISLMVSVEVKEKDLDYIIKETKHKTAENT